MLNERITEDIVKKHFESYKNKRYTIEQQKSSNPKIDKLLKSASKKGMGKGYPEFIISFINNNPNFIIVVECKASISQHQSNTLKQYDKYAVDGSLLYASFLSKEYDVLAIGVSGQNKRELKVSHHLYLKGNNTCVPIFSNKLLGLEDYLNGYIQSPEKTRQDYETLISFSLKLNQELHSYKILESQRGLLISSILIALENQPFKNSYKDHDRPEDLANNLVDTVTNQLRNANIQPNKLANLSIQFGFIRTDTTLSGQIGVLSKLIEEIDTNVNSFIKTHKYYDVLGQLYIEFLRYANSDKSLGIVLTPPHITELFCDLARVNKDSIVYDNVTGTGGFLISALRSMIKDANGDLTKQTEIKQNQIIGVEYQAHIFALACSNMFIHRDGKTNIILGNCFNNEIIKQVKKFKPNIGFLNPPYQNDKKIDKPEFEFILNNLDQLQPNGICIAIVPMERVLATTGRNYELKKELLLKHTLEAVMSMPDQLFINSDTGTVTAIVVCTAHNVHPPNKETYFGYWKDDGFVKRKNKGRIDAYNNWNTIKTIWLDSFYNRKNIPGLSVTKCVTAEDEWCAEAYMETDYTNLAENDFIQNVKKYVLFKKMNLEK